jgi:hypothetical protein
MFACAAGQAAMMKKCLPGSKRFRSLQRYNRQRLPPPKRSVLVTRGRSTIVQFRQFASSRHDFACFAHVLPHLFTFSHASVDDGKPGKAKAPFCLCPIAVVPVPGVAHNATLPHKLRFNRSNNFCLLLLRNNCVRINE